MPAAAAGDSRAQRDPYEAGGVEQGIRGAAECGGLPRVSHHVRESAAGTEAGDGAALPTVGRPPIKDSPAHQRASKVAGRRSVDGESGRGNGSWGRPGQGRWSKRRAREGPAGSLLEGGDGLRAVSQVVQRLPRVAGGVRVAASPADQNVGSAVAHLELEKFLHLVLQLPVGPNHGWGGNENVLTKVLGATKVRSEAFNVELRAGAPRGGDVQAVGIGRRNCEYLKRAHPARGQQRS